MAKRRVIKGEFSENRLTKITNGLTRFALFLFYMGGLPFLLGSIAAGIVIQFLSEPFLEGGVNLMVFLVVF